MPSQPRNCAIPVPLPLYPSPCPPPQVETVGDAYLAVANLRCPQPDSHARLMAQFAFAAVAGANALPVHPERPELGCLHIRVGLHCGPVVASVVGALNRRCVRGPGAGDWCHCCCCVPGVCVAVCPGWKCAVDARKAKGVVYVPVGGLLHLWDGWIAAWEPHRALWYP